MEDVEARKSFDERFVRSHRHVFRYIAAIVPNRDDAEEVFQNTCLKMLEKWRDYDAALPIEPWACGIAGTWPGNTTSGAGGRDCR